MLVATLPDPDEIDLQFKTSDSLTVHWPPYMEALSFAMYCRPLDYDAGDVILDSANVERLYANVERRGNALTVLNLHPKTKYVFWLLLFFENRTEPYKWPSGERFVFETLADKPNPPGQPHIAPLGSNMFKINWTASVNNGSPIEEYSLEGLRFRVTARVSRAANGTQGNYTLQMVEEVEPQADKWTVYYEGNETYWIAKDLSPITIFSFRVRARNTHGWSEYSPLSEKTSDFFITKEYRDFLVLAVAGPILMTFLIVIFSCILCGEYTQCLDILFNLFSLISIAFFVQFY